MQELFDGVSFCVYLWILQKRFFFLWNKIVSLGCIWHENACDDVINTSSYPIPAYVMYSQVAGARELSANKAKPSQS